jgi:mono/diheme cytochrome c family protein
MRPLSMISAVVSAGLGLAVLAACASEQTPPGAQSQDADLVAVGRDLVVRECASCHAIDRDNSSPRPDAPPMNTLLARYDPEMLAEDLIEGIRVGHDDMPQFDFNPIAADALVAYLKSIESKDEGG